MNSSFAAMMPFAVPQRFSDPSLSSLFPSSQRSYLADLLVDRLGVTRDCSVLDIGCRDGSNTLEIACRTGAKVIGVDENPVSVRKAIQARRNKEDPMAVAQFFAERPEVLPFADNAFDFVVCDRFQNTANDLDLLAKSMIDFVKLDGVIVVSALYLRRERVECIGALNEWLGDSHMPNLLGDVIALFESRGMVLNHFEPLDEYLAADIESMIWGSFLEPNFECENAWGKQLSRSSAGSLLKAVDNRDIGYASLVLKFED